MTNEPNIKPVQDGQLDDRAVDLMISNILRYGLLAASALVITGGFIYLSAHSSDDPHASLSVPEARNMTDIAAVIQLAMHADGLAIIRLGILLLLATPLLRVAFAGIAFLRAGDYKFVAISIFVMTALVFGIVSGRH